MNEAGTNILKKIDQFIKEVGNKTLTPEQVKVYAAFTKTKGNFIKIGTRDKYLKTFYSDRNYVKKKKGSTHPVCSPKGVHAKKRDLGDMIKPNKTSGTACSRGSKICGANPESFSGRKNTKKSKLKTKK